MEKSSLTLQPSEQAVLAAASRIFAAYIVSDQVREGQEQGWLQRALREAVWLAQHADDKITADDEMS
jgi:hypothetical protein